MEASNTLAARTALSLRMRLARSRASGETSPQRPRVEPPVIVYERPTVDPNARPRPRPPPPPPPPPPVGWTPTIKTLQHSVWGTSENAANKVYQFVEFGASGPPSGMAHAVLNWPFGMLHGGIVADNCRWIGLGGNDCNMRWGLRGFDVLGAVFTKCEFKGAFDEHGAYLGAPRDLKMIDCRFEGMGGAGIQIAHRWWVGYEEETIDPMLGQTPSVHLFQRCTFRDMGDPSSTRFGAFTISEHPAQVLLADGGWFPDLKSDVILDECEFYGGNFEHYYGGVGGQLWRSNRSLMVGNRSSLHVLGGVIDCPDPVHGWAAQSHNVPKVTYERAEIVTGKIEIKNPTEVNITGCKGNAYVRVGTGPGQGEGLDKVIYEGVVSKDFAWSAS